MYRTIHSKTEHFTPLICTYICMYIRMYGHRSVFIPKNRITSLVEAYVLTKRVNKKRMGRMCVLYKNTYVDRQ